MGPRLIAGVALVAVALMGLTVATPQDASFGLSVDLKGVLDARGANKSGFKDVDPENKDLGKLLDRIDGKGLDPDLVRNLDPEALAGLLDDLSASDLDALGLTPEEAAAYAARLRDPDLTDEELAQIAGELSDKGLRFANSDADGRFDAGEAAYADLDGDGTVSSGDLKLGVLALLLGIDRGLSDGDHDRLQQYELAGGLGLARPVTAASKASATAGTAFLGADGYPTDRAMGPTSVVCVQLYSPSLTCHTRTFVHGDVRDNGNGYLFRLDGPTGWTELVPDPGAPGPRSTASNVQVTTVPGQMVPVPGLTPGDKLVSAFGTSAKLYRDGNGMVWLASPSNQPPQTLRLNLTWAVDLAYYDLPVAADVTAADVPVADRPSLSAVGQAVGLHIAQLAGAQDRPYGDAVRALATYLRGLGLGPLPDRDEQANDLLAVAEAQVGCARQRAEAFTLAAQSLGMPARLVVNEAHAFAEVFVPKAGWHMVDLGGCSRVQVRTTPGHDEVMALQDLPYGPGEAPPSQADPDAEAAIAAIDITQLPPSLRRDADFTIAGTVTSGDGKVPAGIPITFTYNRTKEQPGTPFCSTQTAGDGTYRATCRLGSGTPAGSLQLVARLAPSVIGGGPSAPAYSDPPFVVQKATTLKVVGNARTSADVPVAYTALVRDEDGAAVAARNVVLSVDGADPVTRTTDSTGRARFTVQLGAGSHTLAASLAGDDTYDPANGTLKVEATTTRLALKADQGRLDGGALVVDGVVAPGGSPASGRSLAATWRNDPDGAAQTRTATSGANGVFRLQFDGVPRPGAGLVTVTDTKSGVAVDLAFARSVDATATLVVPVRWAAGVPVPVKVNVTGPVDPVPLRVLLDGQAVADVDAGESLPASVLVTVPAGLHDLTVQAGAGVRLTSRSAGVVVAPVETALGKVATQSPGSTLRLTGQAFFDGRPLEGPVHLRLLGAVANGTSGQDGRFTVALVLPGDATPGNATALLTLPAVGHQAEVPVRIQRPANLAIDAPGVTFHAFGATRVTVRGEGDVAVTADGREVGPGGRLAVDTKTWAWRRITLQATAAPDDPNLSPSTAEATVVAVNPVTLAGGPLLLIGLVLAALRVRGRIERRRAHRNRFLPPRPRGPVRVVAPELPRRVPLVFDPAVDEELVLRLPGLGPWQVRDALGRPVPAAVDGRTVRLDLTRLPPGLNRLDFVSGRRVVPFTFAVDDLRHALDAATLSVLARIGHPQPWPTTMQAMEEGLREAGADHGDAAAIRDHAEASLYTDVSFGRDGFHRFFSLLDDAQARRTAP